MVDLAGPSFGCTNDLVTDDIYIPIQSDIVVEHWDHGDSPL